MKFFLKTKNERTNVKHKAYILQTAISPHFRFRNACFFPGAADYSIKMLSIQAITQHKLVKNNFPCISPIPYNPVKNHIRHHQIHQILFFSLQEVSLPHHLHPRLPSLPHSRHSIFDVAVRLSGPHLR